MRLVYFLGSQEPYEKLKKAVQAEIDEGQWDKIYKATSVPFAAPKSGKISVKVVNHYGDEVLKVDNAGLVSHRTRWECLTVADILPMTSSPRRWRVA